MVACLYSLSAPIAALVKIAEDFTPRFEVRGPLVVLDISGLSRLFGSPHEMGEHLRRCAGGSPVRIAIAPSETAAVLLALGRAGLTVMAPGQASDMLAPLPVSLLADLDRLRISGERHVPARAERPASSAPPQVGEMWDSLPYFTATLERTSELAIKAHMGLPRHPASAKATAVRPSFSVGESSAVQSLRAPAGGGWKHPRDCHVASQCRVSASAAAGSYGETSSKLAGIRASEGGRSAAFQVPVPSAESERRVSTATNAPERATNSARGTSHAALAEIQSLSDTLRRWGIKTLGAFAALPAGEVYERLGARGVRWQRLAHGHDASPLVPWVPEEPFEAALDLEWPIEGLEPLSFVLGRLLEPLADRLERADRGAAILHTHLRLVSKEVHARTLELPAPMRDLKTLRTLMLLDLEANPPSAAIDRVRVLIEPTPARVVQWKLFERAHASPEQVSTLLARLMALMGESHVGSPRLLDTWKPGAFAMGSFQVRTLDSHSALRTSHSHSALRTSHSALSPPHSALRRFRLPVPARVQVQEGRPVKITTDRRGVTGGAIVQAAGPWRTSGEWWNDAPADPPPLAGSSRASDGETSPKPPSAAKAGPRHPPSAWDRDEWDIALATGTVYRIYVEREVGQWFVEGVVD